MPRAASRPLPRRSCRTLGAITTTDSMIETLAQSQPLSEEELERLETTVRELIQKESELVNQRIGWLVQTQGLMFTALALRLGKGAQDLFHLGGGRNCHRNIDCNGYRPVQPRGTRLGRLVEGKGTGIATSASTGNWSFAAIQGPCMGAEALAGLTCDLRRSLVWRNRAQGRGLKHMTPNPSIERTYQRPLRALWPAAHVER